MSDKTLIEWSDATWNIITGCTIKSPGCRGCYAMKLAGTRLRNHPSRIGLTEPSDAGPVWNGKVRFNEQWLDQPQRWKKPRDIFVCAHGDLFHESVPDDWIDQVFAVMGECPWHTFQVLTKRAARMREYMTAPDLQRRIDRTVERLSNAGKIRYLEDPHGKWPLPNVIMMVSAERQEEADERIDDLIATPAAKHGLSLEPLISSINLNRWLLAEHGRRAIGAAPGIDWVIAGGESGDRARPSHPDWFRAIRDQCAAAGVPFHFKQWGEWASVSAVGGGREHHYFKDGATVRRVGKKLAGRLLDGVEHNGTPA